MSAVIQLFLWRRRHTDAELAPAPAGRGDRNQLSGAGIAAIDAEFAGFIAQPLSDVGKASARTERDGNWREALGRANGARQRIKSLSQPTRTLVTGEQLQPALVAHVELPRIRREHRFERNI